MPSFFFMQVLRLIISLILINSIAIFTHEYSGIDRGWISIESILILFTLSFRYYFLSFLIASLALLIEAFNFSTSAFANIADINIFDAFDLLAKTPAENLIYVIPILIIFYLTVFFSGKIIEKNSRKVNLLFIFLILLPTFSTLTLRQNSIDNDLLIFNRHPYESLLAEYINKSSNFDGLISEEYSNAAFKIIENNSATEVLKTTESKKIALIIVESWGYPKNRNELKNQLSAFLNKKEIIIKELDKVYYTGSTVAAELRELCGIRPFGTRIRSIPAEYRANCLPEKFKRAGYQVKFMHAGNSSFYNRGSWYPQIGLNDGIFYKKELENNYGKCYSWPGFCDIKLINNFIESLKTEEKIFFYWMTLNSHMPYDERDISTENKDQCIQLNIEKTSKRCNNHLIIKDFFTSLSSKIISNIQDLKGVEIILVGDHAPPFFEEKSRESFIKETYVPAFKIQIK